MSDDKSEKFQAKPRPGSDRAANSSAAAAVLAHALLDTLEQLAKANGGLGPWFEELEARSIKAAKGVSMLGIDMGKEADAIQFGVDALKGAFAASRKRLAKLYPSS